MPGVATNSIVVGEVTNINDPLHQGRVRVKYPSLDQEESDWARLVSPMAGRDRGIHFWPEVGDEVLVAFEHGDPRRPYVLGALWSAPDAPPADDGKAGQNNWRFIKSRSGHIFKFDDTAGQEKIEIIDQAGAHKIVIDSQAGKIQVTCASGDVEVSAGAGTVKVEALTVEIKASGNMSIEASGMLTIKGATVNIN